MDGRGEALDARAPVARAQEGKVARAQEGKAGAQEGKAGRAQEGNAALASAPGWMLASAMAATPQTGTTVLVRVPGLGLQEWERAHGVPGKRAFDAFRAEGAVWSGPSLTEIEEAVRVRLDWAGREPAPRLHWWAEDALAGNEATRGQLSFGPADEAVVLTWSGAAARRGALSARDALSAALWLQRPDEMRWEEVIEILDLSRTENVAFRRLSDPEHPLVRFRSSFLRDKRRATLALYLNATERPRLLRLDLELARDFERHVRPLARKMREEGEAAYLGVRIENSGSSVAGRIDRILQSLLAESAPGTSILVDGTDSTDPFLAYWGPEPARSVRLRELLGP